MCIKLVLAQPKHGDLLFQWVNDMDVRRNAFHTDPICYEEHINWLNSKLNSDQCLIYICYQGENPIGQIRIDFEGDIGIIDYSIAKEFRGKGYGSKILEEIIGIFRSECIYIKKLIGKVKLTNLPSQRAFEKAGYDFTRSEAYIEYYKLL